MGPGIVCRDEVWLPPERADGVPPLCPCLASMLGEAAHEPSARMLQVALWIGSHALDSERFLLLFLAWARRDSLSEIRRVAGVQGREAVRHRLRRISDAIEDVIAEELALTMSEPPRVRMRAVLDRKVRARPGEAFLATVVAAFDKIVARSEQAGEKTCKNSKASSSNTLEVKRRPSLTAPPRVIHRKTNRAPPMGRGITCRSSKADPQVDRSAAPSSRSR